MLIVVRILWYIYTQACMNNSLATCSRQFKKDCLIRVYLWMVFKYTIMLSYGDCSIRVYRSFITISHTDINFAINVLFTCFLFFILVTHCVQNYAGTIGGSLRLPSYYNCKLRFLNFTYLRFMYYIFGHITSNHHLLYILT